MKRLKPALSSFLLFFAVFCSAQPDTASFRLLNDSLRLATDAEFADPDHTPLTKKDQKNFNGLSYFPFDGSYVVNAQFKPTPDEKPFLMPTTTDRLPRYVKNGILYFELQGQTLELSVYKNLDLSKKAGYENYYFIPFNDSTNGFETYGGGRYMDIYGPLEDTVVLDFNRAYNPYCAYNSRYSCPIPPLKNRLAVAIRAGVLAWKEH
ncbi:MAG: DUF1684 domain-containing protein [Bacteroidia bacterium]